MEVNNVRMNPIARPGRTLQNTQTLRDKAAKSGRTGEAMKQRRSARKEEEIIDKY